jgi:phage terminase large subunit GpA-like protein
MLEWKPLQPTKVWAEENIELLTGAIKGKLKLRYTPHLYRIFDELDKLGVSRVTVKSASQVAKTLTGNVFIFKKIDTDPNDMMIMIPTAGEELNRYMKKKVNPYLNGCRVVKEKIIIHKTQEKLRLKDTEKQFAGGSLSVLGSSKPKTISVKYALFDEVADFKRGAVGEALERMKTFLEYGGKALLTSTQEHPKDEINFYFDTSEVKLQYWYKCPDCGDLYYPDETCLRFPSEEEYKEEVGIERNLFDHEIHSKYKPYAMDRAEIECPHCEGRSNNTQRRNQIYNNQCEWVQVIKIQQDEDDEMSGVYVRSEIEQTEYSTIGFDINSLNSYFVPLSEFVDKTISCGEDVVQLNKFYIGYYNKNYQSRTTTTNKKDILLLSNKIRDGIVPRNTLKLYMTVDTQKYGFWFEIKAYQYGLVSNTVAHGFVDHFETLETLFRTEWKDEDGNSRYIDKLGIDRLGNRTSQVDEWIRYMIEKFGIEDYIYGFMGEEDNKARLPYREVVYSKNVVDDSVNPTPFKVLFMNNNVIKTTLNDTIQRSIENAKGEANHTKRLFYINKTIVKDAQEKEDNGLKSVGTDYERQYSSEKVEQEEVKGVMKDHWIRKHKDNHLWDTGCMCTVFAELDKIANMRDPTEEDKEQEAMWDFYVNK